MKIIFTSLDGPKKEAKSLLKLIKKHTSDSDIKLTQVQDTIAATYGWESWNHLFLSWKNETFVHGVHMHWDGLPCGHQENYYRERILNVARASAGLGISAELAINIANEFSESLKPRMLYKDLPVNKEGKWVDGDFGTDGCPLHAGYMTPEKWTQRMWRGGTFVLSSVNLESEKYKNTFRQKFVVPQVDSAGGLFFVDEAEAMMLTQELKDYHLVNLFGSGLASTHTLSPGNTEPYQSVGTALEICVSMIFDGSVPGPWEVRFASLLRSISECLVHVHGDKPIGPVFPALFDDVIELALNENIPESKRKSLLSFIDSVGVDVSRLNDTSYKVSDNARENYQYYTMYLTEMWNWLHPENIELPCLSMSDIVDSDIPTIIVIPELTKAPKSLTQSVEALLSMFRYELLGRASAKAKYNGNVSLLYVGKGIDSPLYVVSQLLVEAPLSDWSVVMVSRDFHEYKRRGNENNRFYHNSMNTLYLGIGSSDGKKESLKVSNNRYDGKWIEVPGLPLYLEG